MTIPPAHTSVASVEEQVAAIAKDVKKIKRRLLVMAIGSYVRLLVLLVPLVLAIIYLPPILKRFLNEYGSLFQGVGSATGGLPTTVQDIISTVNTADVQGILKQLQR